MELQQKISRWLNLGEKSGITELESEGVTLGSALGKRTENQDRVLFFRLIFKESPKPAVAAIVLCDGMGGMASGGKCANLAISTFVQSLALQSLARTNTLPSLSDKLRVAVESANEVVYNAYHGKGGATLSAVVCNDNNEWAGINVGDSRIYQLLNSGIVKQLTIDDTLENQLANLNLPSPLPEFRQLLQYVGMGKGIEPRSIEIQPSSEIKWIVITSDGAHSIPKDIFQSVIVHADTTKNAVDRLIYISEWLGGKDNSTIVVIPVGNNLFFRDKESNFNSFEIWGIPGKAEFFTIPQEVDTAGVRNLTNLERETVKDQKDVQKERSSSPRKQPKKHDQKDFQETRINGINVQKREKKDPEIQVNIEFS